MYHVGDHTVESLRGGGAIIFLIGVILMFLGACDIAFKTGVAKVYYTCLQWHLITQTRGNNLLRDYAMKKCC